jgi:16S rRNA (guanine966-N2)-methyltransferase
MLRIISGKWRHQRLKLPPTTLTRPTTDRTREALFNILAHSYYIDFYDIKVADLFAGSGALGLECLSRGALEVCFIENNHSVLKVLTENIKNVHAEKNTHLIKTNLPFLPSCAEAKDLIFLDPPYQQNLVIPTCRELYTKGWLKSDTLICIETSPTDIPLEITGLICDQQRRYGQSAISFWKVCPLFSYHFYPDHKGHR